MKKSKFTEAQIVYALKQVETGTSDEEVCSKMSLSAQHTMASSGVPMPRRCLQRNQQSLELIFDSIYR